MTQVTEEQVRIIIESEIEPLDEDFRSAKKWALGLVGVMLGSTLSVGIWVGSIDERVGHVESDQIRFEDRIEDKLVRIEALLLQLTKEISNHTGTDNQ